MYTIDEFIERLQELRAVADNGGSTPVAMRIDADTDFIEAGAELCFVENEQPEPNAWNILDKPRLDGSADQVLSIF